MAAGGEVGCGEEVVVAAGQVGPFVGEEGFSLGSVQGAQHAGGHHDAPRVSGEGVGVGFGAVQDAEVSRGGRVA